MKVATSALRFALVGVAATAIHVAIATGLIAGWRLHPAAANGIAFVFANLASYVANTRWSFGAPLGLTNWGRFVTVSVGAWLLTVAIAWAVEAAGGHYLAGIALVVLLVPALSFMAHRGFTYRTRGA